jgi:valyl-tRNA synthetase
LTQRHIFGNFKGMKNELEKTYNPGFFEDTIYQKWEESGFFNPDNLNLPNEAPSYTIVLPPPNITAKLHLGHSAMLAIEDLLIRYHRQNGFRTLWLPGTDHAAIATQNMVEKKIFSESGQSRHDLGKEKFLNEVYKFVAETQATILHQTRKMGASLDWSRLAFTLDDSRQKAVKRMFLDMYRAGIIYRGERVVNWCPRCHSTLADDEVEHKEEKAKLYWIKYGPFILATSRPETKLGDTAVAVNPQDPRYQEYVGQELEITGVIGKFKVKVVADRAVDINFGSGAIKVTPSHSFIDNEIAARHNLPGKKIIDEDGKMMSNCGKYAGMTTSVARDAIVSDMQAMGLIDHIDEEYIHNSARCYRCDSVIEPLPSKQWFISVDAPVAHLNEQSLKQAAIAAADKQEIRFLPERFTKRYHDWMENLHDWCISRQIWYGHSIPAWYRGEEIFVGENMPEGEGWVQDQDTLDTWFSSGMWTFSTLGWPDNFQDGIKSGDLARFHPTQVLETGYEILTLWVSRMVMMSLFALGENPFKHVYLHGTILDKAGKKMSKSKGNGVDPLDMINSYGADAVRLSLLMGATPGNDSRYSEEKIEAKRNFVNKLWNISRFVLSDLDETSLASSANILPEAKTLADRWILGGLLSTRKTVDEAMANFEFSLAADTLYDFTWNKLADWYLEVAKIEKDKGQILVYLLKNILIMWHPFIPYVTEAIWQSFNESLIMVEQWSTWNDKLDFWVANTAKENDFIFLQEAIIAVRNARSENKIEPARKVQALVVGERANLLLTQAPLLLGLRTGIDSISCDTKASEEKAIKIVIDKTEIYLLGAVDADKEQARLFKEKENLEKLIISLSARLGNQEFIDRAPTNIVQVEQEKLTRYRVELENINIALKA